MYLDREDRRPAMTPQLALRVAIIGGVALLLFGVVFFRLWYLQVLSGDRYLEKVKNNQVREIKVQAPRGEIVDAEGRVLVDNRVGQAVKISPDKLPRGSADRAVLYRRLGKVVGLNPRTIRRRVNDQLNELPFSAATVKQDVQRPVVAFLRENQPDYPGVTVEPVFLRSYPHDQIGAHLFGTVGEVGADQLKTVRKQGVQQGDRIGKSGIESEYDRYLRGANGATRVQVDARGRLQRGRSLREPKQGNQLRLSLDLNVQRIAQKALGASKGAFAVMDIKTGAVKALGSTPSFDPNIFAKVIREKDFKSVISERNGAPLTNRAIQGGYPTGSTFKPITATAALASGRITPQTTIFDGGSLKVGDILFKSPGQVGHGSVALREALKVSSDVFFYTLGRDLDGQDHIQRWAKRFGLGRPTGIDLPGEQPGLVPSPAWRNRGFKKHTECVDKKRPEPGLPTLLTCGGIDRPWSAGDNVNLSIGQGDLQASPLQMAVAYAALANGGFIVTPHLGQQIEDGDGVAIQELEQPRRRSVNVPAEHRQAMLDGLHQAATAPGGTSTAVFKDFPIEVAGKTGTAQKGGGRADQSWYLALAPYPDPKYVVAVTDEAGGFGAERAAPVARRILAALFDIKREQNRVVKGTSRTL